MIFEEKTIDSKIVYEGPVFNIRKHRVTTVNGEEIRDIVEHIGGSLMVAITQNGKVLMERQYRKAFERALLELPAGRTDPGEKPEVTAARELHEETGYTAGSIKHLLTFYPTCGYSNETLHIFICRDLTAGETEWDDSECIELLEFDPDELIDMIMRNEIKDAKTIIGLLFARQAGEI
ncbi:MAG: NUDIX hydrolase [Mogibacterium sp.]|nr:NUDIX hydrolase [Mogibacterium sp.]MBR3331409.1 NUDIX hydrolase [Mogibacterium sp.]MBR4090484.1 NUDIX hydrolase [Mogibacterium sp.]